MCASMEESIRSETKVQSHYMLVCVRVFYMHPIVSYISLTLCTVKGLKMGYINGLLIFSGYSIF